MKKRFFAILLVTFLFLAGCSSNKSDNKGDSTPKETITAEPTATPEATESATQEPEATESATQEPEPTATVSVENTVVDGDKILPLTENKTGKVQIQTVSANSTYHYTSYIITSSEGETVVVDPTIMPSKELVDLNPAAIVCTHGHPDHVDSDFTESYDCKKILFKKDDITTKDFHIYTILSSHNGDTIGESGNVIVVFEVDGLRIAHMGDVGQTKLTDEQLKELGKIDIAFMQFDNGYSSMSISNEKGFQLIEQLNPTIIIPTHYPESALPVFEEKYGKISEFNNALSISKEDLPENKLSVYRILNYHKYF